MLRVDSDAVVFVLAPGADVVPAALLLFEIEAGGVREPDEGQDDAGETEPWDDVEACLFFFDVVVQNGGGERAEFAAGSAVDEVSLRGGRQGWINGCWRRLT